MSPVDATASTAPRHKSINGSGTASGDVMTFIISHLRSERADVQRGIESEVDVMRAEQAHPARLWTAR
jgi:hypothetical protein